MPDDDHDPMPILDWHGDLSIPWTLIKRHEKQALANHDQSLEMLAQRGGLSPSEALAVLEDRPWCEMGDVEAVNGLVRILCGALAKRVRAGQR